MGSTLHIVPHIMYPFAYSLPTIQTAISHMGSAASCPIPSIHIGNTLRTIKIQIIEQPHTLHTRSPKENKLQK
jgi:hypothetical protein